MNRSTLMLSLLLMTTASLADTGSDWLNNEMAKLQNQLMARNQILFEAKQYQLTQGYVLPNHVINNSDDAFNYKMKVLRETIIMFAMAD